MNMDAGLGVAAAVLVGAVLAVVLAVLAFWAVAIVDVLRRPGQQWQAAGQNQLLWAAIVIGAFLVGLGPIGALLYWFIARPALRACERPVLAEQ